MADVLVHLVDASNPMWRKQVRWTTTAHDTSSNSRRSVVPSMTE
jgi:hypothetical protein